MIKILLVDDEIIALNMLRALLQPFADQVEIVAACQRIDEAIKCVELYKPDILLLDIELGEGLGFEILEHFHDLNAHVVFITAYDHYALKAIKYHAFDYLLKPVVASELYTTLQKSISEIRSKRSQPDVHVLLDYLKMHVRQKIAVPGRTGLNYFNIDDIVFFEANGSYVTMHLINAQKVVVTKTLKDFEASLSEKGFLRVHKSYMVNIQHIEALHRDGGGYLTMSGHQHIPISPKEREAIIQRIKQASNIV